MEYRTQCLGIRRDPFSTWESRNPYPAPRTMHLIIHGQDDRQDDPHYQFADHACMQPAMAQASQSIRRFLHFFDSTVLLLVLCLQSPPSLPYPSLARGWQPTSQPNPCSTTRPLHPAVCTAQQPASSPSIPARPYQRGKWSRPVLQKHTGPRPSLRPVDSAPASLRCPVSTRQSWVGRVYRHCLPTRTANLHSFLHQSRPRQFPLVVSARPCEPSIGIHK